MLDYFIGILRGNELNPLQFIFMLAAYAIILFLALPIHEFSHAFAAYKMGDSTAKWNGRLTLNPIAHLDPIGSVMILVFGFGFAKPVPVNPGNFKNRRAGEVITSAAGPLSNFLMAFVGMAILRGVWEIPIHTQATLNIINAVIVLLRYFVSINIGLFVFNLLPVPPLDGFGIVSSFLPAKVRYFVSANHTMILMMVMVLIALGSFSNIIGTVTDWVFDFFWFILRFPRLTV